MSAHADTVEGTPKPRPRQNKRTGWAYAGSQRQIQAYVNTPGLTVALDASLIEAMPALRGCQLEWKAPLACESYSEPRGSKFWAAIGRPDAERLAKNWWPGRGPVWDAVALARGADGATTVVLVEAKANAAEVKGGALAAKSPTSKALITQSLETAHHQLGANGRPSAWIGPYYQLANRLAWTHWLNTHDMPAVFAHVLFKDDRSLRPTGAAQLQDAVEAAHEALGSPACHGWATTIVLSAIA